MKFECGAVLLDMDGVLVDLIGVRQTPVGGVGGGDTASIRIPPSTWATGCERSTTSDWSPPTSIT
jgi:hypothetical protein